MTLPKQWVNTTVFYNSTSSTRPPRHSYGRGTSSALTFGDGRPAPADTNPISHTSRDSGAYPAPSLNLSLPERYDGHPDKCRSFLLQCDLYFAHRSGPELPKRAKVAAVISVLNGRALEWATAVLERAGTELTSCEDFIELFRSLFDHPATGKESGERLLKLRQGNRAASD